MIWNWLLLQFPTNVQPVPASAGWLLKRVITKLVIELQNSNPGQVHFASNPLAFFRNESDQCPDGGNPPQEERMNELDNQEKNASPGDAQTAIRASQARAPKKSGTRENKPKRKHKSTTPLRPGTKAARIMALLRRPGGASLQEIQKATGWQPHSVRGFLSGTLKKKLKLRIDSMERDNGDRTYHLAAK